MATRIVMPTFGMYTAEGTFGRWLVAPRARVEAGDLVAEITTEKASYEIESPASGLVHPLAKAGDELRVEGLIGWVLAEGEPVPEEPEPDGRAQGPPLHPERIRAEGAGRGGPSASGVGAVPAPARPARAGDATGDDRAEGAGRGGPSAFGVGAVAVPARPNHPADATSDDRAEGASHGGSSVSGVGAGLAPARPNHSADATGDDRDEGASHGGSSASGVGAGPVPARLAVSDNETDDEPVPVQGLPAPAATPTPGYARLKASPAARRLATDRGVDIEVLVGSGPGGRIVEADVLAAAERPKTSPPPRATAAAQVPWRVQRRIPLTGIRGAVARRLREAHSTTVPLTLTREVRADAIVAARERLGERLGPIPWDAVFVKLFGDALRERPALNAVVAGEEILVLDEVHVGFAVPVQDGLVVPVVRDADALPLAEVAAAVRSLGDRARAGALAPPDVLGGTATVSNLGAHGVDLFTPVLNPPQSVILGVGRIATRPVVEEGRVGAGATCVLSLTFDHRVADGVAAAELLAAVAARMSDPAYLEGFAAEPTPR